jgi:N-methylhydantoinase A
MQSNGGSISVTEARKSGVRCILSGPAGGVVGCQYIGELANDALHSADLRLLTFDMGGTSTDVSLIYHQPQVTSEAEVGGLPIRVPVLDIHTIGAGGGSIATVDAGGVLRVGPESAGAKPGPACYGKEEHLVGSDLPATVSDANLVLGRILPDRFLGGKMPLFPELAEAAIKPLADQIGLTFIETALGIIQIANAHMERALRVISVERGHDPREFTLLSFGGAGSLHAADLARRLCIPQVLIPPYAATLSAFGMLAADVVKDYTQTVMLPGDTPITQLHSQISSLIVRAKNEIRAEGFEDEKIYLESALDMRYHGQSYELSVPFTDRFTADFHEGHCQTYGYQRPEADLEIVNLRVRGTGRVTSPQILAQALGTADPSAALLEHRPMVLSANHKVAIPFYHGESLKPGNIISGPAVIVRDDTTILIGDNDEAKVDAFSNLLVKIGD